jgi:uncharacterized membrane protein
VATSAYEGTRPDMSIRSAAVVALGIGAASLAVASRTRKLKDVTVRRAHGSRSVTVRANAKWLYELWTSEGPLPDTFRGERNVEIIADEPARRLEWRNAARRPLKGGGALTFTDAPDTRGTELRLSLYLEGPGSHAASAFQRLFGGSLVQIAMESLREFKALAEAGEIPKAVAS